jgi:hypothetical protein
MLNRYPPALDAAPEFSARTGLAELPKIWYFPMDDRTLPAPLRCFAEIRSDLFVYSSLVTTAGSTA